MPLDPPWKSKKTLNEPSGGYVLGKRMTQGSEKSAGAPPHGLSKQMMQPGGYDHPAPAVGEPRKLRKAMNQ